MSDQPSTRPSSPFTMKRPTIQNQSGSYDVNPIANKPDYVPTLNSSVPGIAEIDPMTVDIQELKNPGKPTSELQTLMNLIKSNVGIGILAMPSALANAGLLLGTIGILVIGFIATYCMKQLVDITNYVKKTNPHITMHNYAEACSNTFAVGAHRFRPLAKVMGILVNVFIIISQVLVCAAYTLFISQTIGQVVEVSTGFSMKIQLWELIIMVVLIPISQSRSMKALSYLTLGANVCIAISLTIILQYVIRERTIAIENLALVAPPSKWALAFGTILFAFEGINLTLSIRGKMAIPSLFDGWNGLMYLGMTIVACLYVLVSFFGFLYVGEGFNGVITDYMIPLIRTDPNGWLYLISVVLAAAQICVSYGIQSFLIVVLLFPMLASRLKLSPRGAVIGETLFRLGINVLTFSIAAGVPCVNELLSLIGALTGSFLVLMFPPFMELVTFAPLYSERNQKGQLIWLFVKNTLLFLVGVAGLVLGTTTAIQSIVFKLSNGLCIQ